MPVVNGKHFEYTPAGKAAAAKAAGKKKKKAAKSSMKIKTY